MKFFLNLVNWLQKSFRPPSAFSWETLILLSLFSYYMALLASDTEITKNLLLNFAWIFLILGVYWGTTSANQLRIGYDEKKEKDGFPLSPWITGALVSIYIFGGATGEVSREALIYWPVISAIIAAIPDFIDDGLRPRKPPLHKRQNLVILFGTQILLSCWFQFYFVVQNWLTQYPSLVIDDFDQSAFVTKLASSQSAIPRGELLLNAMESKLSQQLNAKPWAVVERSLLQAERERLIDTVAQQAKQQITPLEEDDLWQVVSGVSSRSAGYNLELRAVWQGPRARPQEYSLSKNCQIIQVPATTNSPNTQTGQPPTFISRFECEPVRGWGIDEPIIAGDSFIQ
jgi:hypothetical protein